MKTGKFDHCVFAVKNEPPADVRKRWNEVLFSMSYENPKHREMMDMEDLKKTGNSHLRRVLVEAAWAYQHRAHVIGYLLRRQKSLAISEEAKKIAWKAQQRLHKRYKAMAGRGKNKNQIVTALGRELLGFIWAIAGEAERQHKLAQAA